MASVIVKKGREKSLLRRHPWLFSGAVKKVEGEPGAGETVDVRSPEGALLGRGGYSPHSQITVRIWSFDPDEEISPVFFRKRLGRAVQARQAWMNEEHEGACRLVHTESDGLPGLIADLYGEYLVCQFLTAGAEHWKKEIVSQLMELLPLRGVYERSDIDVRLKEGLQHSAGVLSGEEPPERVIIREGPCRFAVDIRRGHKTGFYLDQKENRALLDRFASGAEVLNCFAYTGAFGIRALSAGAARVTNIESSAPALALARENEALNPFTQGKVENVEGDVFQVLRQYRNAGRGFDLIILDPPKFVESRSHLGRASRGYKDINLLAFRLLRPGGILFTFSCSGLMPQDLFQKIVADAALDAGREAQILHFLGQAPDHPTALNFPEGSYLKGLICRAW